MLKFEQHRNISYLVHTLLFEHILVSHYVYFINCSIFYTIFTVPKKLTYIYQEFFFENSVLPHLIKNKYWLIR